MKILVTGSSGFIGSHLANRLVELGHEVDGVDNLSNPSANESKAHLYLTNLRHFILEHGIEQYDAIFHLAAYINVDESIKHPEIYFENNSQLTLWLLEAIRSSERKPKLIYASSAEVYGNAQRPIMDEDHPLDPVSPYAVSKLAAEQLCKNYAQLYGLDITVIRNFNTFGEYQRGGVYGGVIAKFKEQAKAGAPLTVYGSGEQSRDYMHISQAIEGYVLALNTNLPTIVNFGSGATHKIVDIAHFIAKKFNGRVEHVAARPNEIMRLLADISRAKHYGYEVQTDFWKHLDAYINYEV